MGSIFGFSITTGAATVSVVAVAVESTGASFFTVVESAFPTPLPVLLQFMARVAIKKENPKAFNLHPPGLRIIFKLVGAQRYKYLRQQWKQRVFI